MHAKKKQLNNFVYSTNPNYNPELVEDDSQDIEPSKQTLYVSHDTKSRKGKIVTLIQGFLGNDDKLQDLSKILKSKLGVGGSAKDSEIIIQGAFRDKIIEILEKEGFKTKRKGG